MSKFAKMKLISNIDKCLKFLQRIIPIENKISIEKIFFYNVQLCQSNIFLWKDLIGYHLLMTDRILFNEYYHRVIQ